SRWRISSIALAWCMRTETRARARALQALYAWEMRSAGSAARERATIAPESESRVALGVGADPRDLPRLAEQVWDDMQVTMEPRRFASVLVNKVADEIEEIDAAIADVTTNWRLERLGSIERSVLRLGAAELLLGETPPKVAIQECVRLAD